MEMELDLLDEVEEEQEGSTISAISADALIDWSKLYLGLDISKESTGVCIYRFGERTTYNIATPLLKDDPHWEAKLRRSLKDSIGEITGGSLFDVIVIEDVFEGENPHTTRILYALNTAIDELILDNAISCNEFVRVNNQRWKSWLFAVDGSGDLKGLNDKVKIQRCLSLLGIEEEGKGYQDRLDATGMLLGYLLQKKSSAGVPYSQTKENRVWVKFEDLTYAYETDEDLALMALGYGDDDLECLVIDDKRITKKLMQTYCSEDLGLTFITGIPIKLGALGGTLRLPVLEDGGYLAFRVKEKALKKYRKQLERLEG